MKKLCSVRTIILAGSFLLQLSTLCFHSQGAVGDVDLSFDPGSGVNSTVRAFAVQPDWKVIIVGDFTTVRGLQRLKVARVNADGSGDGSFNTGTFLNELTNYNDWGVYSVALQSDSRVLIGGAFEVWDGTNVFNGIARLNPDGTLDHSFYPGTTVKGSVSSIAVQTDGKVLIGGSVLVGNSNYVGVARLNDNGSFDNSFKPAAGGVASVFSLALQPDGKVLVGVDFFTASPDHYGVARLNANGSLDGSFNPGTVANSTVLSIAVQSDGKLLIGGWFTVVNGTNRSGIARLNANGSLDSSFDPYNPATGLSGYAPLVNSVAVQTNGQVVIGGSFSTLNFTNHTSIARLNADGSPDSSFNASAGVSGEVLSVAVQSNGQVFIGGYFRSVNGTNRNRIARINADGSLDVSFEPGTGVEGQGSSLIIQPNGKVLVGGANKLKWYSGIARLNPDGSEDDIFDPDSEFENPIALEAGGKVLIGGSYHYVEGTNSVALRRLYANGSLDDSFNPDLPLGVAESEYDYAFIEAVAVQPDGKVLVAGEAVHYYGCGFEGCGGVYYSHFLTRLNTNGSRDISFSPAVNVSASSLALQSDGKVLVLGNLTLNGTNYVVTRLNADGSLDNSFNSVTTAGGVSSIVLQSDGKVLLAGSFTAVHGTIRNGVARLNADGNLDSSFDPASGVTGDYATDIYAVAVQSNGAVLLGGHFSTVDGTDRNNLARLNSDGSLDNSFNPGTGADGVVRAIALQSDGNVLIGGEFLTINGVLRPHVARLFGDSVAPSLNITRSDAFVIVSWPVTGLSFHLLENTDLSLPNSWLPVAQPPLTNAGQISVTLPTTVGGRFFRLSSQ